MEDPIERTNRYIEIGRLRCWSDGYQPKSREITLPFCTFLCLQ